MIVFTLSPSNTLAFPFPASVYRSHFITNYDLFLPYIDTLIYNRSFIFILSWLGISSVPDDFQGGRISVLAIENQI